ncbi:MAG: glycosyltransferase family 9 protein, partial [Clostridia bacterium]|nr:glycosyltransferase family 9 protein [Clostridia bacterium]
VKLISMFDFVAYLNDIKFFNSVKKVKKLANKRKSVKGVVTIVKYDGIGDFILFLDAAKGLRQLYKDKKIILTCSGSVKQIALDSGYFDEVICFSRISSQFLKPSEVVKKIKKLDCELLIHATISRDFFSEAVFASVKADKKISMPFAYLYDNKYHKWVLSNYNEFLDVSLDGMVLQINAEMVKKLGYKNFTSSSPLITAKAQNIAIPNDYFVIFLGGSSIIKRWYVERWYEVAKYITNLTGLKCVLAGDTDELNQVAYFENKNEFNYYSYVGKTSLEELIYLISKAQFVIGNDTSAIHIAASVKVKSLCVTSAASLNRFYPYVADNMHGFEPSFIRKKVDCEGCSFSKDTFISCVKGVTLDPVKHCLRDITVNDFIEKFNEFIKN